MRPQWLPLLLCSCLASCEKVKDTFSKVANKVSGVSGEKKESEDGGGMLPGGLEDPALTALVDANGDGVLFRKDLPFPTLVTSRASVRMKGDSIRIARQSALGAERGVMNGVIESDFLWERTGDQLVHKIENSGFRPALAPGEEKKSDKAEPAFAPGSNVGLTASFHRVGADWKADKKKGDFRQAAWLQNIESGIVGSAINGGALPRRHWFGKRRFKEGDAITLTGDGLKLLSDGIGTGKIDLVYEGREAIAGHPCGRFSIHGDYRLNETDADGNKVSSDISITSGKIWLSLVHPLVLRDEQESVMSSSVGTGGAGMKIQGAVVVTRALEWKAGS